MLWISRLYLLLKVRDDAPQCFLRVLVKLFGAISSFPPAAESREDMTHKAWQTITQSVNHNTTYWVND